MACFVFVVPGVAFFFDLRFVFVVPFFFDVSFVFVVALDSKLTFLFLGMAGRLIDLRRECLIGFKKLKPRKQAPFTPLLS